jgi:long-chain acyl-CoA synthetase
MININFPDKPALITRDKSITYKELLQNIDGFSQLFKNKGFEKIAICAPNSPEWIYAFYAGWKNNAIVVPIDASSAPDDIAFILNDCQPGLIFIGKQQEEVIQKAISLSIHKPQLLIFEEISLPEFSAEKSQPFETDLQKTAVIIYTSGTTGNPKGVMLSYANLIANVKGVSEEVKIFTPERQTLLLLPLHHIFPLAGNMLAPLYSGGTMVICPSMQSADIMEMLQKNKVNIMIGVPRFYELLYKGIYAKISQRKIAVILFRIMKTLGARMVARRIFHQVHESLGGHLEVMVSGGAALNPEVGNFFYTLGFQMLEGFGMTEAAPMITFTRPGSIRIGYAGQALPGLSMEIRDGEIVAKGPNVMQGYYNRPQETAETLRDGWLYTGDIGTLDKNGFLQITGRIKEIIVLPNGKNISPVELEEKLGFMAAFIKEVAVLMHNEMLHAIIVPDREKMPADIDLNRYMREDLLPHFNREVSAYKRITQYTIANCELPRTKLGKIQRFKLSELIREQVFQKQSIPAPVSEEYISIKNFIENLTEKVVSPDDHLLYDVALDSLGRISLIDFIEKTYGVTIAEQEFQQYETTAQLADHVHAHKKWLKVQEQNWSTILKEKVSLKLPRSWPTVTMFKDAALSFFSIYFRFSSKGIKNMPEGPCIIAPNHQSFFDGLFVASFLKGRTIQKTYFFAKKKHVNTQFARFMANRNNVIVVDTQSDLKESLQKMAEVLKKGKKIILFPEGTRTKTGYLGEFKKTFAILSKELNVPVVPVAITGAYRALPSGALFPRPFTRVQVNFMQPIYPQKYSYEGIKLMVMQKIRSKLGE